MKKCPYQGRIQDFKLGGALKKIAPSGGRRENLWGISCEKSRFYAKKSYFFPILGGEGARAGCAPSWIRPCILWLWLMKLICNHLWHRSSLAANKPIVATVQYIFQNDDFNITTRNPYRARYGGCLNVSLITVRLRERIWCYIHSTLYKMQCKACI
jgi:hypothetical protein